MTVREEIDSIKKALSINRDEDLAAFYYNSDAKSHLCSGISRKAVRLNDPNLRIPSFHGACKTDISPISERNLAREGTELYQDAKALYDKFGGVHADFDYHPDQKELDMNNYNPIPESILKYIYYSMYPPILIECKALGTSIDNIHPTELNKYYRGTNAVLGVLTNGDSYKFYTNPSNSEPAIEFRMTEINEDNIQALNDNFVQIRKSLPG